MLLTAPLVCDQLHRLLPIPPGCTPPPLCAHHPHSPATRRAANMAAVFSQLLLRSEQGIALTLLTFVLNAAALFLAGMWA